MFEREELKKLLTSNVVMNISIAPEFLRHNFSNVRSRTRRSGTYRFFKRFNTIAVIRILRNFHEGNQTVRILRLLTNSHYTGRFPVNETTKYVNHR